MSKEEVFYISIPSDVDGYIMQECPSCGEKFMIQAEDIENESQIEIWCPGCGLVHDNYMTDDVIEVANKMIENYAADILNDFTKNLEKSFKKNKYIKIKSGEKIRKKGVDPLMAKTGDYLETEYKCCHKTSKVQSIRKFSGGYCPFCGEMTDGD